MRKRLALVPTVMFALMLGCGDSGTGPTGQPFTASGSGNTVFDMPSSVDRVRITGVWNGTGTSNFIVRIGGRLVVNEILRDMPDRTYSGVHLTGGGGTTEITNSSAVSWTFLEER